MASPESPTRQRRIKRIAAGAEAGKAWLEAMFRTGLASGLPLDGFDEIERRMIDSQAAGLARKFRLLAAIRDSGEEWQDRFVEEAGLMYLLLDSFLNLDRLPPGLQQEVLRTVGISVDRKELLDQEGELDVWDLAVQREFKEGRLVARRSWFLGRKTGRWVCVQQYRITTERFEPNLILGESYKAEAFAYPGSAMTRVGFGALEATKFEPPGGESFAAVASRYAELLTRFPWAEQVAGAVSIQDLARKADRWSAQDRAGNWFTFSAPDDGVWRVAAFMGSDHITLYGEWDGRDLMATSLATEAGFFAL